MKRLFSSLSVAQDDSTRTKKRADHSNGHTRASAPAPAFLKLPLELREMVYETLFDEILLPPEDLHPTDPVPTFGRLTGYLSVVLTNRQLCAEAKAVFDRKYAKSMTFYFDNIPELEAMYEMYARNASPPEARFCLQYGWDNEVYNEESEVRGCCLKLMGGGPSKRDWYKTKFDIRECGEYKEVMIRPVGSALSLREFIWKDEEEQTRARSGCMVLEGRVCDLQFEDPLGTQWEYRPWAVSY